jgi:uncharacterized membrane protein (GlpM family)
MRKGYDIFLLCLFVINGVNSYFLENTQAVIAWFVAILILIRGYIFIDDEEN